MEDMRYLTFALGKGRLAKKTLELFEKIGITCEGMKDKDTRKLIFVNEELKLRFFLAKGPDVPTYVEYGADRQRRGGGQRHAGGAGEDRRGRRGGRGLHGAGLRGLGHDGSAAHCGDGPGQAVPVRDL